ncbi:hypothetical protein [Halapricum desulfuricans]|uniref:Uncharacterized protein n=1 Tax=Halapricum desulfuricans TaxID=2841257 RepID=A0A897NUN3_9EURY|nr:hypothetical protein [Halapricum desulfuricans]QSG14429.1 hypothetical protein HSEST_0888 [Halapricum desulfuricans]
MARLTIEMPTELAVRGRSRPVERDTPCSSVGADEQPVSPDVRQFLSWFACWSPINR